MRTTSATVKGNATVTFCESTARCCGQRPRRIGRELRGPSGGRCRRAAASSPDRDPQQRRSCRRRSGRPARRSRPAASAERDLVEQRLAAGPHRDRACASSDGSHGPTQRALPQQEPRKNGAPITAVTMPIGSSAGAASMRANGVGRSAAGPRRAHERRQQQPMAGPITSRNRCGTTMPTKPMTPATATAAPVGGGDQHDRRRA